MIRIFLVIVLVFTVFNSHSQNLKAYQIYDRQGDTTSFSVMVDSLATYDVILFGEFHDHPVTHWLELKVTEALYAKNTKVRLGAEMFETDNQLILDEYLQGKIPERRFEEEMRLWDNYKTDYKPLVAFAKKHQLPFIATNVPRRYATAVATFGLDILKSYSKEARGYIAELPVAVDTITPGYAQLFKMMGSHSMHGKAYKMVEAQAIKDATMAERITKNLSKSGVFIHFNGDYHSKDYGGIYWYLQKEKPKLKIAVISVQQSTALMLPLETDDNKLAHFTIVVPHDFTKTF